MSDEFILGPVRWTQPFTICDVLGLDAATRYAELCRRAQGSRYWTRRKRWIDRRGGYSEDYIAIRGFYDRVAP